MLELEVLVSGKIIELSFGLCLCISLDSRSNHEAHLALKEKVENDVPAVAVFQI